MGRHRIVALALFLLAPVAAPAFAIHGHCPHGVGIKAEGMGGATLAYPQDALAGSYNPATLAFLENRLDVGVDWLRPDRRSRVSGNLDPLVNMMYDADDKRGVFIPELGFNKTFGERIALGLTLYGQCGMNTSYGTPVGLFGTTPAGMDLDRIFIVPCIAVRIGRSHSLGLGMTLAWQRFEATGLENFDRAVTSIHPGSVTDNNHSSSAGVGFRVGWLTRVGPIINVAVAYQSRTYMGEIDEYRGLLAEEGDLDVPSAVSAGVAVAAGERAVLAFDVSHIRYADIGAIGNPMPPNLDQALLGHENGAGFGWKNTTVYKLGIALEATRTFVLRGGFSHGEQPIPESETLLNILTPAVVEDHATLGITWRTPGGAEISLAYMHGFEQTVEGGESVIPGASPAGMGGGEVDLRRSEDSFAIAFGTKF